MLSAGVGVLFITICTFSYLWIGDMGKKKNSIFIFLSSPVQAQRVQTTWTAETQKLLFFFTVPSTVHQLMSLTVVFALLY